MSIVKILHESAMQYMDIADKSKITNDLDNYKEYLNKAFVLEKEAALKVPLEKENSYWQYMLIRSAGWLAYECGRYEEAYNLTSWGLAGTPSSYEKKSLEKLYYKLEPKIKHSLKEQNQKSNKNTLHLYGMLASADVEQGEIKVKEYEKPVYHILLATKDLIQKTARHLIGEVVKIDAISDKDGKMTIEYIGRVV